MDSSVYEKFQEKSWLLPLCKQSTPQLVIFIILKKERTCTKVKQKKWQICGLPLYARLMSGNNLPFAKHRPTAFNLLLRSMHIFYSPYVLYLFILLESHLHRACQLLKVSHISILLHYKCFIRV